MLSEELKPERLLGRWVYISGAVESDLRAIKQQTKTKRALGARSRGNNQSELEDCLSCRRHHVFLATKTPGLYL